VYLEAVDSVAECDGCATNDTKSQQSQSKNRTKPMDLPRRPDTPEYQSSAAENARKQESPESLLRLADPAIAPRESNGQFVGRPAAPYGAECGGNERREICGSDEARGEVVG